MRERTAKLNLILEGSNDGVWVWYLDEDRVEFSRRWLEMIDCAVPEDACPEFWFDLVHPRDLVRLRTAIAAHLDGLEPFVNVEFRIRHANGTYRWMLCRGLANRDPQGLVHLLAGTQSDVTALRCVDTASGLPNERSFRETIEDLIAQESGAVVALLAFNRLGDLVEALDSQGVEQLRSETRQRLLRALPVRTMLAQLPGNQFGVVFAPGEHNPEAALRAVCRAFDQPTRLGGAMFHWLGLSIGVMDLGAHRVAGAAGSSRSSSPSLRLVPVNCVVSRRWPACATRTASGYRLAYSYR